MMDEGYALDLLKEAALYRYFQYDSNGRMRTFRKDTPLVFPPTNDNVTWSYNHLSAGIAVPIVNLKNRFLKSLKDEKIGYISLKSVIEEEMSNSCDDGRLKEFIDIDLRSGANLTDLILDVDQLNENMVRWIGSGRMYGTELSGIREDGSSPSYGFESTELLNKTPLVKYFQHQVKNSDGSSKGWKMHIVLGRTQSNELNDESEHMNGIVYNIPVLAKPERNARPIGPYFFRLEFGFG